MFHSFFTSYFPYNKLIFCAAILSLFSRIQNCSVELQSTCLIIQITITIIIAIMNVFLLSVIFSRSQIINLYKSNKYLLEVQDASVSKTRQLLLWKFEKFHRILGKFIRFLLEFYFQNLYTTYFYYSALDKMKYVNLISRSSKL